MTNIVYQSKTKNYILNIYTDTDADPPRDDAITSIVTSHRHYNIGDKKAQNTNHYTNWIDWLENEVISLYPNDIVYYLPVYMYDHSGITINTTGFNCRWDSGQIGWIYMLKSDLKYDKTDTESDINEKALNFMRQDISLYNMYLTGEVYGYTLCHKNQCTCCKHTKLVEIDSCWGIYAKTLEEIKECITSDIPDNELQTLLNTLEYHS